VSPWWRFRRWRHLRGHHRLCKEVRVVDHYETGPEYLVGMDDNGQRTYVDATVFGGRAVYKKVHG
jgi:hypothetical protein